MADNDAVLTAEPPPPPVVQQWPTLNLPPQAGIESLFSGSEFGLTPFCNFFSGGDPNSDCRSFSPLLDGAMASPPPIFPLPSAADQLRFNQNPSTTGVVISQPPQQGVFIVPPGISPASLLESPGLFPGQGLFGMSHQQVTAQAQSNLHMQYSFPSSVGIGLQASEPFPGFTSESMQQNMMPSAPVSKELEEPFQFSSADQRSQRSSIVVDKPADDGYKWKKYGQRQVKGSELIQSYYKCMHPNCLVRKKVGCSLNGQVTEIIYRGQHSHQPSQELSKNSGNHNENLGNQGNNPEYGLLSQIGNMNSTSEGMAYSLSRRDQESSQATSEHMTSEEEEVGNDGTRESEGDEDEPDAKRRNMEVGVSEQAASRRAVTEPRFIIQTTSKIDLLDDGYRWRKYGQKVVKGNPHPRSYYKCTTTGCNVRKNIERLALDPKEVRTTYEGRHNHEVPAARTSSHNSTANNSASQLRPHHSGANNNAYIPRSDFTSNNQQIVAVLRIEGERIT